MSADDVYDLEDAGGDKLCNMMVVDGLRTNTFLKPPEVTAAIIRNIKNLNIREDDVMLCSAVKSGTHWLFEIVSMLLKGEACSTEIPKTALMLSMACEEDLAKQPRPRVLNTHMPFSRLPDQIKQRKTKLVLILRNPKDTAVSYYHHHKAIQMFQYDGQFKNYLPLFVQGKLEWNSWFDYVLEFEKAIEDDKQPIHLLFYEDLKENGHAEISKIAKFLGVNTEETFIKAVHDKCEFKKMAVEKEYPPELAKLYFKPNASLFRKGVIGDWKNHFTVALSENFDKIYEERMATSKLKFRYQPTGI